MNTSEGAAAPVSGNDNFPAYDELAADPEIAALLDFEPVPRKRAVEGGWTAELQREFIARLAADGSPGRTCDEMGKNLSGMMKIYRSPLAESFRAAWDGAVALAKRRRAEAERQVFVGPGVVPPSLDHRRKPMAATAQTGPLPGQVLNEYDEWEDQESYDRRAEEAKDSVSRKLLRCRRMYLAQIADCPGKRAAFEILTEYPVDWDKARALEPQDDEPYNIANQRQPDMILTAQAGWLGDFAHGRNRMAEARDALDAHRAEQGLEAIDWEQEASAGRDDDPDRPSPPVGGEGRERGPNQ